MPGWPVTVPDPAGRLLLRALRADDATPWLRLRADNREHLAPWEVSTPAGGSPPPTVTFAQYVAGQHQRALDGSLIPFVIELDGALVGQVQVGDIVGGAQLGGALGYWVARAAGGRGIGTRAVALALDWSLGAGGLHRVEVNVRVENAPSLALVRRLGLRREGLRERYLHVDGDWRDHVSFALTREEVPPDGLIARVPPLR